MSEHPADDDATWNEIVANFGERVDLPVEEAERPQTFWNPEPDDDHFEPPLPPPLAAPQGLRGLAWLGLLGSPLALVLIALLRIDLPGWGLALLGLAFVSSLVYLVATMSRKGPSDRDLWDDGSRV